VATDRVSGVRGQAGKIAGNNRIFFVNISRLRGVAAQPRSKRVLSFSRLLLGSKELVSGSFDRRDGRI
jgi:DNA polymerase II small subunit/DNA polymerase delta subunit B